MRRRILSLMLAGTLATAGLAACSTPAATTDDVQVSQSAADTTAVTTSSQSTAAATTAATAIAENSAPELPETAAATGENAATITLDGTTISADSPAFTVDGTTATITAGGTYTLSGTLADGQIVVDSADETPVVLVLNGVSLSSASSAPLYVKQAASVEVVLADGSANALVDTASYVYASADMDEPNAALFSDVDLRISGTGTLNVSGNFNDGIASKDGLVLASGNITVTAVDDGIRGKDELIVKAGTLSVNAGGDGLKADNDEDATKGYVAIEGGTLDITAGGDGISAATDLLATGGEVTIVAGGGSGATLAADASAKGLKAGISLVVDDGTFAIDAADDALHSDGALTVNGGTFDLATGDDGLHAESDLAVNGGAVNIRQSYEGVEGANIVLNAGSVAITSSDDGVNAASGDGASAEPGFGGRQGGPGGSFTLTITGGTLVVDAGGDGLDANGTITMSGGLAIVNGPTERMNSALDYDGSFTQSGGTLVAVGSAGMAMAPSASSSQHALLLNFDAAQQASTLIQIADSAGNAILTFAPSKAFQSLSFSSPALVSGETYSVALGGSATGAATSGLYEEAGTAGGTAYTTFTVSSVVTQIGNTGRGGFR
jgi:hypothetical protein